MAAVCRVLDEASCLPQAPFRVDSQSDPVGSGGAGQWWGLSGLQRRPLWQPMEEDLMLLLNCLPTVQWGFCHTEKQ